MQLWTPMRAYMRLPKTERPNRLREVALLCGAFAAACGTAVSSVTTVVEESPALRVEVTPVVLLHGLGRSERAMWRIQRRFADAGFEAHAVGYDSRDQSIDEIVAEVDTAIESCCADVERIHFVTHSLGGIVLRAWAEKAGSGRISRAVMLSPPNHGSEIVDRLGRLRSVLGPTGKELGSHDDSAPNRLNALGPVRFELGVIAGNRSMNPIGSWILDGPDDGTVSVASARVQGMRDFLVVPSTHGFMNYNADVAFQALHFVQTGAFARDSDGEPLTSDHDPQEGTAQ